MARQGAAGLANSSFPSALDFDDPNIGFTRAHAVPKPFYTIKFSNDGKTLVHILKAGGANPAVTKTFRVYFASVSLASPAQIANQQTRYNVAHNQSALVGSIGASATGTESRLSDPIHAGLDGWFFATATNLFGIESDFSGPIRNPIVGTNDGRVAPSVLDQAVDLLDGGLDPWGRQLVNVVCSAKIPAQGQGVSTVVVVDGGSQYETAPTVAITGGGGTGAEAFATVQYGQVAFITVTKSGQDFTTIPTVTLTGGGFSVAATAVATLTVTGSFAGYQIYLQNYFSEGIVVEGPSFSNGSNQPGQTLRGKFPLLQDTPPDHPVVLYFVSLSQTGTRRDDITSSPSVTKPFGIFPGG